MHNVLEIVSQNIVNYYSVAHLSSALFALGVLDRKLCRLRRERDSGKDRRPLLTTIIHSKVGCFIVLFLRLPHGNS